MTLFKDIGIGEGFEPYFKEFGFKAPSDVQRSVIPKLLEGNSVAVTAQTGTGKTLSYCLPLVKHVKDLEIIEGRSTAASAPVAIVMLPTRELVTQVGDVLRKISHHQKIRVRTLIGGLGKERSVSVKGSSFDVLVTTPRKLMKAVTEKEVSLSRLKMTVFDEADNLFEMGYADDVIKFESYISNKSVQLGFFTATMPGSFKDALSGVFSKYGLNQIKMPGAHTLIKTVEITNIPIEERQRYSVLSAIISKKPKGRGIVFVTQKTDCQEVFDKVSEDYPQLKKTILHGDMDGLGRRSSHKSLKDYKVQVLFATDLAARGIDLEDISWVINYDLPKTTDYYLHRCGRTGRMGRSGFVFNFVSLKDKQIIARINKAVSENSELKIDSAGLNRLKARKLQHRKVLTPEEKALKIKAEKSASRRGAGRAISRGESERLKKERAERLEKKRLTRKKDRAS